MRALIIRTLVTSSATNVLGLINAVLLSRWLGPSGRGEIAAAFLWPGLLIYLGSVGLTVSTMYFSSSPDANVRLVLNNAIRLGALVSLVSGAIGLIAMPWLLHSQSAAVVTASRWYIIVIPLSLLSQLGIAVLQGRMRFKVLNWLNTIIPSGYLLGTIVFMAIGRLTLMNVVLLHLCLNLVALVCTFAALARIGIFPGLKTDPPLAKSMFKYGAKLHVGQLSGYVNLNLDQALIAAWLPPAALGLYVVAVSAASIAQMFSSAVQTVAMPAIAREPKAEARREVCERVFSRYWLFSILIVLALGAALPFIIPRVFGPSFRFSVVPAEILLIGALCMGAKGVLGGSAMALGDPWLISRANLLALPVTVVLLYALLPKFGLMGAAIASAAAYFAELSLVVYGLRRNHSISPANLFRLRLGDLKSLIARARLVLRRNRLNYTPN